jgi:N-acetylglutamate synthase-like GNAT family acetyltransferase
MSARYSIRRATEADLAACERILRALPEWFGIEAAIVNYVAKIPVMETYVAERAGMVVGFITLTATSTAAFEIHVMAIAQDHEMRPFTNTFTHFRP